MRMFKTLLTMFVLQVSATALYGLGSETTSFNGVNTPIPDGTIAGIQDVRTITSGIVELTAVRIRLKISGNFNGDLYGYVRRNSAPTNTHISVLLNRPGRTSTNSSGYTDYGLDVTFADAASNDIHNYESVSGHLVAPLSGVWQPDARFVNPTVATADSPRSAFLSVFDGL